MRSRITVTAAFAAVSASAVAFSPSNMDLVGSSCTFFSKLSQEKRTRSKTEIKLYRKFHDYGWNKLMPENLDLDTVPESLRSNLSPVKGAPQGTNVVANIRSLAQFPLLGKNNSKAPKVLRLARSAFLETQSPGNEALITPMTIHVLNFVVFPNPSVREVNKKNGGGGFLGLPILGADVVSLPGNKHLVALDFQPVLPLNVASAISGHNAANLFPSQYSHLEKKLHAIHAKYQNFEGDVTPLLPWGGDIPPQAQRFFSPYALWTRLGDNDAIKTVETVVWDAFKEYVDLYFELMIAVQEDIDSGLLDAASNNIKEGADNRIWDGQNEYLEYRRLNDPARPMLQRLYGNDWAERVIGDVLFPEILTT
mmetsp:Transcript_10418/g.22285  ORF Transcript_10418/g.22285 Transcript_10418/m.22285 type:complete len:366 (+) Transcript_10418:69-1166(+)